MKRKSSWVTRLGTRDEQRPKTEDRRPRDRDQDQAVQSLVVMVIKASAASEIRQLIAALGAEDEVRREAAIARLAVLGARAVDRLIAAYESAADRDTRIAILRALESVGDRRTVPVARGALSAGGDLGVAAASALRGAARFTARIGRHRCARRARGRPRSIPRRTAGSGWRRSKRFRTCLPAYGLASPRRCRPIRIRASRHERSTCRATPPRPTPSGRTRWKAGSPMPRRAARGGTAARRRRRALSALQKLIDAIRAREGSVRAQAKRTEWQAVRGALHQALALRGSRVAVYDLRETIEGARGPVPVSFLAALHVVGDASCLEPLAAAYARREARRAVAPPARRGVPRDRAAREGHAAARRDEADRGAVAGRRARLAP